MNDIWGATTMEWNKTVWESSLDVGLRTLRLAVDTHAITSHFALPLLIKTPGGLVVEVTDGTARVQRDATTGSPSSTIWPRHRTSEWRSRWRTSCSPYGATAVSLSPGWLRSEAMLEAYGVTESNWRDATTRVAPLRHLREPGVRRPGGGGARAGSRTCRAGTESRCPAGSWRRSTASPISTAASPMPGGTFVEVQDAGKPADVTGYQVTRQARKA